MEVYDKGYRKCLQVIFLVSVMDPFYEAPYQAIYNLFIIDIFLFIFYFNFFSHSATLAHTCQLARFSHVL